MSNFIIQTNHMILIYINMAIIFGVIYSYTMVDKLINNSKYKDFKTQLSKSYMAVIYILTFIFGALLMPLIVLGDMIDNVIKFIKYLFKNNQDKEENNV